MERPLPEDVARPARAYLAALVPPDELSDAWHELVDDVAYWGDRELLPVLGLAHQVVLQHERVAPEVAALALVESGVEDPADVAVVLGADEDDAREWTRAAVAARDGDDAPPTRRFDDVGGPAPEHEPDSPQPDPAPDDAAPDPAPAASSHVATTSPPRPAATSPDEATPSEQGNGPAMRIGFEDDRPLPIHDEHAGEPRWTTRRILVAALVLWLVVVVVWLLTT